MKQYHDLINRVLAEGVSKSDRTGTGTLSVFGHQSRFDLSKGFPLLTTKKIHLKSVIYELLWFLRGDTDISYLQQNGVSIWNEWADENLSIGPCYGKQWRSWECPDGRKVDQIKQVIDLIRQTPDSRRLLVSAWNVADLPAMALMPCHAFFQCYVANGRLSMQMYQRSADIFLGVPFNWASYALLLLMLAQQTGLAPGELIWTAGDAHIYNNHLDQVRLQITREPYPLPTMQLRGSPASIDGYAYEDFELVGYQAHPHIKGKVAV